MTPLPDPVSRQLRVIDRRLRLQRALAWSSRAAALGLIALIGVAVLASGSLPVAAAVTTLVVVVTAVIGYGREQLGLAAAHADREAGLHDLLKTCLELETGGVVSATPAKSSSPWFPMVRRRSEDAAAELDAGRLTPIRATRWTAAAALALAALLLTPGARRELTGGTGGGWAEPGVVAQTADTEIATLGLANDEQPVPTDTPTTLPTTTLEELAELGASGQEGSIAEGAEPGSVEDLETGAAAPDSTEATLHDERRDKVDPGAAPTGDDSPHAGGDNAQLGEQRATAAESPVRREISDEVVALEMPGSSESPGELKAPGEEGAEATAMAAVAAEPGTEPQPADADAQTDGPSMAGDSTGPQQGEIDPFGEATELAVTLEDVLLEAAERPPIELERTMLPSRRQDAERSLRPRGTVLDAEGRRVQERAPAILHYSTAQRRLLREYFAPDAVPPTAPADSGATDTVDGERR